MAAETETERVRRIQDKTAPSYDRRIGFFERVLFGDGRRWVCEQADGDVLEIAAGTARNLPFYRDGVRLTGIELSPEMLAIARERAAELGRDADLRVGDAQALEFGDQSFDTVVCTLGLCTIPSERQAIREALRVLRPGGRLLLLEHVRSPSLPVRVVQRLLDPLAVRFEADHLLRDPLDHLEAEGFQLERVERSSGGSSSASRLGDRRESSCPSLPRRRVDRRRRPDRRPDPRWHLAFEPR
ncbi:MAG: class I SAM-dependent methyltransferase [Solirubrobacterales bacterium]